MKKKGTFRLKREFDGNVTAEIVNQDGRIEETREFGVFSEAEFHRLFQAIREELPHLEVMEVTVTRD